VLPAGRSSLHIILETLMNPVGSVCIQLGIMESVIS